MENNFTMRTMKVLFATGAFCLMAAACKPPAPPKPPPPKVSVFNVTATNVVLRQQWVGSLDGYPNAQIRAQVTGYLMKQNYLEGGKVKKGDLLFEIDPRPFQAALDQALAKQQQDQANLGKTELDVKRFTPLAKTHAVSQQELDDATAANLGAIAGLAADKAAVENAQLNIGFTKITSPVDGIAGLAQAQIGDLVGPASGVLTTVSTVDPIRAYFNISEQLYLKFRRLHPESQEFTLPLELILSDGTIYPRRGKWIFTSRQVDPSTGTLQVAAEFENPDNLLRPGQYALIRAETEVRANATLVPQRAVNELQGTFQVAVVETNTVHVKNVVVGDQIGNQWLIESGISPGDQVIVEGLQKAPNGSTVDTNPPPANAPTNAAPASKTN